MKVANLNQMIKGWFVGDFVPSVLNNKEFEVAVKYYKAGDREDRHIHKVATEITVIVKGKVKINESIYTEGDILLLEPFEEAEFYAITDAINVVVKTPSITNDKFEI